MTNAEARCNKSLRPRKPEGSLGRTAQDVHLDSHTAPELWDVSFSFDQYLYQQKNGVELFVVCCFSSDVSFRLLCFCLMFSDAKSILGTIMWASRSISIYTSKKIGWGIFLFVFLQMWAPRSIGIYTSRKTEWGFLLLFFFKCEYLVRLVFIPAKKWGVAFCCCLLFFFKCELFVRLVFIPAKKWGVAFGCCFSSNVSSSFH